MYTPLFLRDSELILIACHARLRIKQAKDAVPERINRVYTDRCVARLETGAWACCVWRQGMHVLEFQCIATCTTLQQALEWLIGDMMAAWVGAVDVTALPEREPASGCDIASAIPHLPAIKQRQLCAIVRIIRATADVERVILFGSHARGDWVDDTVGGYVSDFDLLVLVASPALAADEALWADCQERAREVAGDTPVSLIAHTVDDVRQQLARGSSFFRDVMSEGIALYDAGRVSITVPELTPAQRLELAQISFTRFFEHAAELYRSFERNLAHGSLAIAAFELHQVAETIHKAMLLVFTAYQPKLHDLDELGRRCARVAPGIGLLVPVEVPDRKRLAGLLRAAYVDARYSFSFQVSREDLEALAGYVGAFRARVERACREQLADLAVAARCG